jgi:polyphosphate kinase
MAKKKDKKARTKVLDDETLEAYDRVAAEYEQTATSLAKKAARFADNRDESEQYDFSYTQNREVSWLRFDNRVLDEAYDPTVPLFERLKFCSIFSSNLDEWFMIRVGGLSDLATLKHQPADNKSNETPSEQLAVLFEMLPDLIERQSKAFHGIEGELADAGLEHVYPEEATEADKATIDAWIESSLSPIISPMVVDPRHPFPNLRNGLLYVMASLDGPEESGVLGMVEVPPTLPRVVELPSTEEHYRYTLIEDIIIARLGTLFGQYEPTSSAVIRVTRNADIDPDGEGVEEEEDYRQHMKKVLKRRQRLQPVRLEMEGELDPDLRDFILDELELAPERVTSQDFPMDLGYVFGLEPKIPTARRSALVEEPFEPQQSPMVDASKPVRDQVLDHDVLLFYPYESMNPLLNLLHEASSDDECISVKITLYRVAKQSRLCESLIAAAENGKDVTVLMELRARFDEENNIEWAERLENAGCTVIYGSEGFKCHSKICQITYHADGKIRRITCLGTGNFNEKTARLYSDFMLLTAHEGIGEDGNSFFRNLSIGNLAGSYKFLGVAPIGLKPLIMRGLDREIGRARSGEPAKVFMKLNSLTDRDVIDKISEACEAGVTVIMIIRGICCIRAGVPGKTDGLIVHQIVGRLLEHSRVYAFGADTDVVYLSSADMMTRNTERRVEICYPVLDPVCRDMVIQYMNLQVLDNVKARRLTPEGTWEPIPAPAGVAHVNSQQTLIALAYRRAMLADDDPESRLVPLGQTMASLEPQVAEELRTMKTPFSFPELVTLASEKIARAVAADVMGGRPCTEAAKSQSELTPETVPVEGAAPETASEVEPEPMRDNEVESSPEPAQAPEPVADAKSETCAATEADQAASVEPEPEPKAGPEPMPAAPRTEEGESSSASPTDVEAMPVEAHVIEDAPSQAGADAQAASSRPEPAPTLARRQHGRFYTAFALIGLGFKTLLFGKAKRADDREDQE